MKKSLLLTIVFFCILVACKKENENPDNEELPNPSLTYTSVNITNAIDQSNVILNETTNDLDGSIFQFFGSTNNVGLPMSVSTIVYHSPSSDTIVHLEFNELQQIETISFEVNGVQSIDLIRFTYLETNKIGIILSNYNWSSQEESIVKFAVADFTTDPPAAFYLKKGGGWLPEITLTAATNLILGAISVVGIAYLGLPLGTAYAVAGALTLLLANVSTAGAAEITQEQYASSGALTNIPLNTIPTDPCINTTLTAQIAVKSGNVLTALAVGTASAINQYFWSTGDFSTAGAFNSITVPGPGTYYVLIIDEFGCSAFGSAEVVSSPIQYLIDGSPWRSSTLPSGNSEKVYIYGQNCTCWSDSIYNSADVIFAANSFCFTYVSDSTFSITDFTQCPSTSGTPFEITSIGPGSFTCLKGGVPVTYTSVQ
jgi:hypothetical protein